MLLTAPSVAVNIIDNEHRTPLYRAADKSNQDTVELFVIAPNVLVSAFKTRGRHRFIICMLPCKCGAKGRLFLQSVTYDAEGFRGGCCLQIHKVALIHRNITLPTSAVTKS